MGPERWLSRDHYPDGNGKLDLPVRPKRYSARGVSRRAGTLNFIGVIVAGTLGSYLGAAITYWISRALGRALIVRYGRFINPEKLEQAERWLARYETGGVFFARLLPDAI